MPTGRMLGFGGPTASMIEAAFISGRVPRSGLGPDPNAIRCRVPPAEQRRASGRSGRPLSVSVAGWKDAPHADAVARLLRREGDRMAVRVPVPQVREGEGLLA